MDYSITNLLKNLGIEELSDMQKELSSINSSKDIILLSPTGTGKTLAYILQILSTLDKNKSCLILAPSRELSIQIAETFKRAKTGLKIACCYGGHSSGDEKNILKENPEIIIGTPGRIIDQIEKGNITTDNIEIWTIDEFDKVLELGFKEQIEQIYHKLKNIKRKIFVSATFSDYFLNYIEVKNYHLLDYTKKTEKPSVKISIVKSEKTDKIETLKELLHDIGAKQSIIFCNYRESVERISDLLDKAKIKNVSYHGGMEQMDREKSLSRFSSKSTYTLVTTDLASRGLDIDNVDSVIHYHIPINEEIFIHRNGRTARWQTSGRVFIIINENDKIPEWIKSTSEIYNIQNPDRKIPEPIFSTLYIGKGKKDKLSKGDIMGFLCKKASLNKDDIGTIILKDKFSFVAVKTTKVKQAIKMIANEKIKGMKTIIEIANS